MIINTNMKVFDLKYLAFVIINFLLAAVPVSLVMIFFNIGHGIPYNMISIALICVLLIVLIQYPILKLAKSWLLKSLIFFVSMNLFLFLYGESFCLIDECIGDFPGLKMIIFGNMSGAIVWFFIITLANYCLRKYLF